MSLLDSIGAALKGKGGEAPGSKTYWPILIYATLMAMAFLTLVPIVWMVLTAFKSAPEVAANPPTWSPREWHPENFAAAWNFAPFGRYLINSLIMVGGITILQTVTSALAAYAFARLRFRGRDLLFLLYLGTLMIPPGHRHTAVHPHKGTRLGGYLPGPHSPPGVHGVRCLPVAAVLPHHPVRVRGRRPHRRREPLRLLLAHHPSALGT